MVVSYKQVQKTYPKQLGEQAKTALKGISFHLAQGETLGLIGPNGAGKSTTIRLLLDFIRPDQGEILLFGKPPGNPAQRRRIGYLPEVPSFPPNLTCMDVMRFAGDSCHMDRASMRASAEKWLTRLGLWEARNRLLRGFSKGMKQRASFAMALLHDPELLILDEPMSGLDPIGRAEIVDLIRELKAEGRSVLFCSHLLNDVERLVDRVLVLHEGEALFHGSVDELMTTSGQSMEEAFLNLVKGGA